MPIRYSSNRWGHKKKTKKKNGGIKKKNRELSIIPATACLSIKVIVAKMSGKKMTKGHNNPKPDLDNINGQIIILNQILIISMHIASWLKGLVIYSSYCPERKIWACLGQRTP